MVYMGIVGNDREGDHVRTCMAAEVSIAHLRRVEGPNKAQVTHAADGDRVRRVKPGIRRKLMLRMDEDDLALIAATGHVHSSCFSYLEPELPRIRAAARGRSTSPPARPGLSGAGLPACLDGFSVRSRAGRRGGVELIARVLDLGPTPFA
jgi:fructoselysine 6-kinase